MHRTIATLLVALFLAVDCLAADLIRDLQTKWSQDNRSPAAHWGNNPQKYSAWTSHTNRLVPVYTFGTRGGGAGVDLTGYCGVRSPYRTQSALKRIYGGLPSHTLNPQAEYFDQTNVADLQFAGLEAGKKHIFLVIFDGMDWQTTRAAAIHKARKVAYRSGRGTGLHFLDYTAGGTTQYGFAVTSPHNGSTRGDVNRQTLLNPGVSLSGGYNPIKGGPNPWTAGNDDWYTIGKAKRAGAAATVDGEHIYADSAGTATAMTTGVKTYNGALNVDRAGNQLVTIAHRAQRIGYSVGAVSSVPISHATPATAYAHNVSRNDYQDLTRDMLGLPSIAHPQKPLVGLDVLIGGGYGVVKQSDKDQGTNFVRGNQFLTNADLTTIDERHGGQYVVAVRRSGVNGANRLQSSARQAVKSSKRLFGMYGIGRYKGHLPYQTADGDYQPAPGRTGSAERYTAAERNENPNLAEMTTAAVQVLSQNRKGFWLMVEAGDVDWANHDNNLDNSIGAVHSGDAAVKVITDWVEAHSNWKESLLIVTADHGHYLVLEKPELLVPQ